MIAANEAVFAEMGEMRSFLAHIISLRGPKLTFRDECYVWVMRAGEAPRAWRRQLVGEGGGPGKWSERRPPADDFLRMPGSFANLRKRLVVALYAEAANARTEGAVLTNTQMLCLRRDIRAAMKLRWLEQWLAYFPPEALKFVVRSCFPERRWHLINLWLRVPQGRELFDALPALAWMLASSWCYKLKPVQRPLRSIRALVTRPRRHILRWLDLPEGEGTLRLLKQFRGQEINLRLAHAVCKVLRDDNKRRCWLNLPKVPDYDQLCLLAYDMPVSPELLRAINEGACCGPADAVIPVAQIYRDTMNLLGRPRDPSLLETLRRIRSPERLRHLHDDLVAATGLRQLAMEGATGRDFVLGPPLEPSPWLRPLRDTTSLVAEAAEMRHCASSYDVRIATGQCYLFAVLHPLGRATLSICPLRDGRWFLAELRGESNRAVASQVHADVNDWLGSASPLPGYEAAVRKLAEKWGCPPKRDPGQPFDVARHLAQRPFTLNPPLEPQPWLRPVCDTASLVRELAEMGRRFDADDAKIVTGRCYLYSVYHPLTRATLCIRPLGGGRWYLAELRGEHNRPVDGRVHAEVNDWLASSNQRPGYGEAVHELAAQWDVTNEEDLGQPRDVASQLSGRPFTLSPPLEPPPWLRPVCDTTTLVRELAEMGRPANAYDVKIATGQCYLYSVYHQAGRATLCIRPIREGRWYVAALLGPYDREVVPQVHSEVAVWMRSTTQLPGYDQEVRKLAEEWGCPMRKILPEVRRREPAPPHLKPLQLEFDFERSSTSQAREEDELMPF